MPDPVVNEAEVVRARKQSRNKPNPSRHSLKCAICNHPDRAAIEFDFLNWRNPFDLVKSYRFRGLSTIYRHAHATGLFAKRRLNLRFAMERIVERVNEVPVTATAVIRAAAELPRINGKPAAPEVILTLTPEFARCQQERNRAIEADRRAKEEAPSAPSSSSSLPQATVPNSAQFASRSSHRDAPPALTSSASPDAITTRAEDLVASPSSTLPEAAPDKPAIAKQSPRAAGPPLGSSGSADPPFPFIPRVPLRHHARRHFLIENEMRSRGEPND